MGPVNIEDQAAAIEELAQSYVWRIEVEQHQAGGFLTILEAMGYLAQHDSAAILEALYPSEPEESKLGQRSLFEDPDPSDG